MFFHRATVTRFGSFLYRLAFTVIMFVINLDSCNVVVVTCSFVKQRVALRNFVLCFKHSKAMRSDGNPS